MKRKPMGKRLRFEIFDRDGYQCQYCGKQPPTVCLEVDHIIPVKKGGTNDKENLRTSCVDCNRGKSTKTLHTSGVTEADRLKRAQESAEDVVLAKNITKSVKVREKLRQQVCGIITEITGQEQCRQASITTVVNAFADFGAGNVMNWLDKAASVQGRGYYPNEPDLMAYFCGILKNKRNERND